jgi:hypothetical protein
LDAESIAVLITVVSPIGKRDPEAGAVFRLGTDVQLSLAITLKLTVAPEGDCASTSMNTGQLRIGSSASLTVMVKLQEV